MSETLPARLTQATLASGNVASFGYDAVNNRMTQSSTACVTRSVTTNAVGDIA